MTPASAKARRILRRTLTGSSLALAVALILWWNHRSGDGRPLLYVTAAVLLGAVFEASRMGSLAALHLLPALLVPAAGVVLLLHAGSEGGLRRLDPVLAYAWCGALAASAYALDRALSRLLGPALSRSVAYLALGLIAFFVAQDPLELDSRLKAGFLALAVLLATCLPALMRQPRGTRGLAIAVGLALLLVPPLPLLGRIGREWSTSGLVALLVCAKIGDSAGYYVGTAFGRRHPFPKISPGKTVEGCLGSFAAGTAAGGAAVALGLLPGSLAGGLLAGAIVNLASQAGDLGESWVKRRAGVKDSSAVFGPAGGLLDQIDSLLLAVPVAVTTWPWILRAPSP